MIEWTWTVCYGHLTGSKEMATVSYGVNTSRLHYNSHSYLLWQHKNGCHSDHPAVLIWVGMFILLSTYFCFHSCLFWDVWLKQMLHYHQNYLQFTNKNHFSDLCVSTLYETGSWVTNCNMKLYNILFPEPSAELLMNMSRSRRLIVLLSYAYLEQDWCINNFRSVNLM